MKRTGWQPYKDERGNDCMINAEYGMREPGRYFSITAESYRVGETYNKSYGCQHEDVLRALPHFADLVRWHLCSWDGPMHYIANAIYWWEKAMGRSKWGKGLGEPDAMEAFKSTIVFGALASDKLHFDALRAKAASNEEVQAWLEERLPMLRVAFEADLKRFGVLS